jgi:hypothetical protein
LCQLRRLHLRLHDFESDDLACRLHVCPQLSAMADGKASLPQLVSRDIVNASRLSHDHRRRIGVDGHDGFILLCSASDCFVVVGGKVAKWMRMRASVWERKHGGDRLGDGGQGPRRTLRPTPAANHPLHPAPTSDGMTRRGTFSHEAPQA